MINNSRVVVLLRGCSGSGKSEFANYLACLTDEVSSCPKVCIVSADDFFTDKDGNYNFNHEKLGLAHRQCKNKFFTCLKENVPLIIVSNTNSKEYEFNYYLDIAKQFNYTVFSIVIENRHGNKNSHNVPEATIQKCAENIKNSLKLY